MDQQPPTEKKYGLIIPSKNKGKSGFLTAAAAALRRPTNVFADGHSSDENLEEEENEDEDNAPLGMDWRSRVVAKPPERSMQANQARQRAMKALEEDPTVFQYDEVYDEMQQKKEEKKPQKKEEKKPKYITELLRTAEVRKIETERRQERKVQKEREAEGDQYKDKDAFVTPAYRAKLAELKKLEEEERLRELREGHLDVTKQSDLSGFYRHLYKQTFAEEDAKKAVEEPVTFRKETGDAEAKCKRQYRARRDDQEEDESDEEQPPASGSRPAPDPEDAKPDVNELEKTVGSGKSKQTDGERPAASASLVSAAESDRAAAADRAAEKAAHDEKPKATKKRRHSESSSEDEDFRKSPSPPSPPPLPPVKVKIDIWKKRASEETIHEARERYLARKQAREDGLVPWP